MVRPGAGVPPGGGGESGEEASVQYVGLGGGHLGEVDASAVGSNEEGGHAYFDAPGFDCYGAAL